MKAQDILAVIKTNEYALYGLRSVEPQYAVAIGDYVPHSHDFDGYDWGEDLSDTPMLDGASTLGINYNPLDDDEENIVEIERMLEKIAKYDLGVIILVTGTRVDYGSDEGEWVMQGYRTL